MRTLFQKRLLKYAITIAVGLAMAVGYIAPRDLFEQARLLQYHILCDAFTLPGLFMILLGMLFWMGNTGALDTISYAFHYLLHTFIPVTGEAKTLLSYAEERRENRIKGFGFLFIVGACFMAVGVIFLLLFYSVY